MREYPPKPITFYPTKRVNITLHPSKLRILYILLVHDQLSMINSIIHALNEPQHHFIIHVDLKAQGLFKEIVDYYAVQNYTGMNEYSNYSQPSAYVISQISNYTHLINPLIPKRPGGGIYSNIYIMQEEREACNWGGFTIVNATLNAMRLAIFTLNLEFDYCLDVSGTSYPLKTKLVCLSLYINSVICTV